MSAAVLSQPPPHRPGIGLRLKLSVGLILIIALLFATQNALNLRANQVARRAEALSSNETMTLLIAGALVGELVDHEIESPRVRTFIGNFSRSALKFNANNQELAFVVVVTPDRRVVGGDARPNLTLFSNGLMYSDTAQVLQEVAKVEGHLGTNMTVKRFDLRVGSKGLVGKLLVGTSLARIEREARRALLINLTAFLAALAALFVYASLTLSYWVVGPIRHLVTAMQKVQSGNLTAEVDLMRGDEIGALAHTYNFMVRGLRERERLKDAFNRYVSRQVYEKFERGEIALTGETLQATVLFSDIRSFTSLSEQLTPTQVVAMLNEYFNVMVEIVFEYDGLLNKFIGDALMAIYNVPLSQTLPELRAVQTAVKMMTSLDRLNTERQARGDFPIHIGIGINTGSVVAGNIGHERRLEYTVIGDAVNLAQRLESQTKMAGATILISASTHAAVAPWVVARPLEPVLVKGKAEPVALYAVDGFLPGVDVDALLRQVAGSPTLAVTGTGTAPPG